MSTKAAPMSLAVASRGAFHNDIGNPTGDPTPLQMHETLNRTSQMSGQTGLAARIKRAKREY